MKKKGNLYIIFLEIEPVVQLFLPAVYDYKSWQVLFRNKRTFLLAIAVFYIPKSSYSAHTFGFCLKKLICW